MVKGAVSKEKIKNKILEVFPGSFLYDGGKEIRIPMMEDGIPVQIKVGLTAAKTNVEPEGLGPRSMAVVDSIGAFPNIEAEPPKNFMNEPSDAEKATVAELLKTLGLA